jgi:kinesin family protein 6/9
MYDLLSPVPTANQQPSAIDVQEDSGRVVVKGLSLNICETEEDALNYLFEGETNRTIS